MSGLSIYIIDNAVQLAPRSWLKYRGIKQYQKKFGRRPLVNASVHQNYLKDIPRERRNDRPDILHFGLLTALGYHTFIDNLSIFFTLGDHLYQVQNDTRLPRAQSRFYGILETLLSGSYTGSQITGLGPIDLDFPKIAMTRDAPPYSPSDIPKRVVFGGFSTGSFRSDLGEDTQYRSLSSNSLELWTAISRFLNLFQAP